MIRYKEQVFKDYFIDPETAIITDKNGIVQEQKLHQGRLEFKGMRVHVIQAWTYKYKEMKKILDETGDVNVHHDDRNPLNNTLSNLIPMSREAHGDLHRACAGQTTGLKWYHKGDEETCAVVCPEGWEPRT